MVFECFLSVFKWCEEWFLTNQLPTASGLFKGFGLHRSPVRYTHRTEAARSKSIQNIRTIASNGNNYHMYLPLAPKKRQKYSFYYPTIHFLRVKTYESHLENKKNCVFHVCWSCRYTHPPTPSIPKHLPLGWDVGGLRRSLGAGGAARPCRCFGGARRTPRATSPQRWSVAFWRLKLLEGDLFISFQMKNLKVLKQFH